MATRSEARPVGHGELTGWPAWVRQVSIDHVWADAVPERVAQSVIVPATLLLRLTMGWIFAYAGFEKLINSFTASGFLLNSTKGPLTFWFHSLGGSATALNIVNPLVVWGEILVGLTLVFGIFTRSGLFWGAVMMMMYYLAQWPPTTNPFMSYYLIYILAMALVGGLAAGRILGVDAWVERLPWVKRHRLVALLLG